MQERSTSHGLSMDVIGKAVAFPFTHFLTLIKIGLFPWLLSYIVAYGVIVIFSPDKANEFSPAYIALINQNSILPKLLTNLADVFIAAIVAVGIHRAIISQEQPGWTIIRLRQADIAYLVVGAMMYLVFIAPLYIFLVVQSFIVPSALSEIDWYGIIDPDRIPISSIIPQLRTGFPGFMLVYITTLVVSTLFDIHFAMAFPHAAVSGTISLRSAWTIMKNRFWRFLALVIVFGVVIIVLSAPLFFIISISEVLSASVFTEAPPNVHTLTQYKYVIEYAGLFLELIFFAMMIAFISYCYVGLTRGTIVRQTTNTHP